MIKWSEMTKNDKKVFYAAMFIFTVMMCFGYIKTKNDQLELKKHGIVVNGTIVRTFFGNGPNIVVEFYYKKKKYSYATGSLLNCVEDDDLIGTRWPIMISRLNPENNDILMTKKEFKEYGLIKPDSLIDCE
jgi:hypothetical protein